MAVLYGECLIAYEAILRDRKNLDAITRKGFDLHFMDSEGKISNWGYSGIKDRDSMSIMKWIRINMRERLSATI